MWPTVEGVSETRQGAPARRSARERLLAAADELFYADGLTSTCVDAVIDRAGVATGSLYNNFSGKDALIEAYLHDRDERWRTHWESCIAEHADPVERVLALFTAVQRWNQTADTRRGCAHLAAAVQLPADHPGARAAAAHKQHLTDRLHELCGDAVAVEPADLAQDLLLIYEGMHNMIAMDLDTTPIGRARRLATRRLTQQEPRSSS